MAKIVEMPIGVEDIKCSHCGVQYCLTNDYIRNRRQDHATFYCPNGHGQHYPAPKVQTDEKGISDQEREDLRRRLNDALEELRAAKERRPWDWKPSMWWTVKETHR